MESKDRIKYLALFIYHCSIDVINRVKFCSHNFWKTKTNKNNDEIYALVSWESWYCKCVCKHQ